MAAAILAGIGYSLWRGVQFFNGGVPAAKLENTGVAKYQLAHRRRLAAVSGVAALTLAGYRISGWPALAAGSYVATGFILPAISIRDSTAKWRLSESY